MYYGRHGELKRYTDDMNNKALPAWKRYRADKARQTVWQQLKDGRLMRLRERLIRASQAGDDIEVARIGLQMQDYLQQDRESGIYEV